MRDVQHVECKRNKPITNRASYELTELISMKILTLNFQKFRRAVALVFGLCAGNALWAASIQSINLTPNPLVTGHAFTIAVTTTPGFTRGAALVDFHAVGVAGLQISLTNQGAIWSGSAVVPTDIARQLPSVAGALVRVAFFDMAGRRVESAVSVGVNVEVISAIFQAGVLTVTGDNNDNTIIVSRDAAGTILVNGGSVLVTGGVATAANASQIQVFGLGGNDVLTIDDANGAMPPANLSGGEGNDTLTGGANADVLDGGPGDDILLGRGGDDVLQGGPGNDTLNGGQGTDQMIGGDGDDLIIWDPGDGSDVVEGQGGNDTLLFNGANIAEVVDLSANGQRLRFFRNVGTIVMDCDGVENVVFNALGGADQVTVNNLTGTQVTNVFVSLLNALGTNDGAADTVTVQGTDTNDVIKVSGSPTNVIVTGLSAVVTVVGGESGLDELAINGLGGDDMIDASAVSARAIDLTLNGGTGNDFLIGGEGDDVLNGQQGNDTMFGGPGNDTFPWNPGEGSDLIEGQDGVDTMLFNGANIAEEVELSANGQRLRFIRNIGSIVMDCDGVEVVKFNAFSGADKITVNDLSGTDVRNIDLDLATPPASGHGDNTADNVIILGTESDDVVTVAGTPDTGVTVQGLTATVSIVGTDPTLDNLFISLLGGSDVLVATDLQADVINLTADGGAGDDVLVGSHGNDTLFGGEGDDVLNGGPGQDVLDGGPGANVIIQD
jgi:Ca2+-binding RTX toxin-like protein